MDASIQDDAILGGAAEIAKTASKIESDPASVRHVSRSAGPVPEAVVLPHTPSPIQGSQAFAGIQLVVPVAIIDRSGLPACC